MSKSVKHSNPYRDGSNYNKLFGHLKVKQIVTKKELIDQAKELGMTDSAATATATVILSPRESSKRGDCRGNASAQGHLYFIEKLGKKAGESQKFRLRWRTAPMEKLVVKTATSQVKAEVSAVDTAVVDAVTA